MMHYIEVGDKALHGLPHCSQAGLLVHVRHEFIQSLFPREIRRQFPVGSEHLADYAIHLGIFPGACELNGLDFGPILFCVQAGEGVQRQLGDRGEAANGRRNLIASQFR